MPPETELRDEGLAMEQIANTPAQLSHALRRRRKSSGWTQKRAGDAVGLLPKTVSALETTPGGCRIESLLKLVSALGLELVLRTKPDSDAPPAAGTWS